MGALSPLRRRVSMMEPMRIEGRLSSLRGLTARVADLPAPIGALVRVGVGGRAGEVVGFDGRDALVMLYDQSPGVRPGDRVVVVEQQPSVMVSERMLGRVLDGFGAPIDGLGVVPGGDLRPLYPPPLGAMSRGRVTEAMATGVRAIDAMATMGRGQRLGIFAGPGVGKSTLLGMLARRCEADVIVIALVGERGREVRDFIEGALGADGLRRSVVVVATGDESALMRVRAASAACTIAESFRDRGADVMLMIDSVTRFAHAQRQIGLAVGEPPATRGYTPSVFAALPVLLERAGRLERAADGTGGGSISAVYTVLVEGDDMSEPVADTVRGILDGHIVLSRALAQAGRFPAIDVLDSVSRVADEVCDAEHVEARRVIRRLMAARAGVAELLEIGAYVPGSNADADRAIELNEQVQALLCQAVTEESSYGVTIERLKKLARVSGAPKVARRS